MLFLSVKAAEAALEGQWRWPHFSVAELACRCAGRFCAGEYYHDAEFLDGLEALRAAAGRALAEMLTAQAYPEAAAQRVKALTPRLEAHYAGWEEPPLHPHISYNSKT